MAYDEGLAQRVRERMAGEPGLSEKKMFGGIGFMIHGNMACGVSGDALMLRVGKEGHDAARALPHTREFDVTGRPMRGWITVEPAGLADDGALAAWVQRGIDVARALPPK